MSVINRFTSEYSFLSNFYPNQLTYRGDLYPTVEHAFQAAKATTSKDRLYVRQNSSPMEAKKRGQKIQLRADWDDVSSSSGQLIKVEIMEEILRIKFAFGTRLAQKLLDTGEAELIEGNKHGDSFWGVCRGTGQNWLGKLLMRIRADLRQQQAQAA